MNPTVNATLSGVQAREKEKNRAKQQKRTRREQLKREQQKALANFNAKCPKTKVGIIARPSLPRKTKMPRVPSAYAAYVIMIDKLKTHSKESVLQTSTLMESATVRWRKHLPVSFDGTRIDEALSQQAKKVEAQRQLTALKDFLVSLKEKTPSHANQIDSLLAATDMGLASQAEGLKKAATGGTKPARKDLHFVLQIRSDASAIWEDLLEVKDSGIGTKNPGLGLFASRPFKRGEVISLYCGKCFDPGKSCHPCL
jgi:hypothetical protein